MSVRVTNDPAEFAAIVFPFLEKDPVPPVYLGVLREDLARGVADAYAERVPELGGVAIRRRGYGGALTAHVTGEILARGEQACLYTDLANPTSNKIYAAAGYLPVADFVDCTFAR